MPVNEQTPDYDRQEQDGAHKIPDASTGSLHDATGGQFGDDNRPNDPPEGPPSDDEI
jgi:hypothetical protein